MSEAFQKTVEGAVAHAMEISTPDKKGWFVCYTRRGQTYFCMSLTALPIWGKPNPGWLLLGVLRADGRYKLRRGWKNMVITARLTA